MEIQIAGHQLNDDRTFTMFRPEPDPVLPGQESVWDYPRPAVAELCTRKILVRHRGRTIAETHRAVRTLETSHPPSYYIPPDDIDFTLLTRSMRRSFCEWKGSAAYWNVCVGGETIPDAAWSYATPSASFEMLRDHLAFYAGPFDECRVDGELVQSQPGPFYGGWISRHVAGPFKGSPGTSSW